MNLSTQKQSILWLQLLGIGFIPLEMLLVKVFLAGPSSTLIPSLERLITCCIGIIYPSYLLFRKPADWASFIFIRLPLKGRSIEQHQISKLQDSLIPRVIFLLGSILLVWLFYKIDESAFLLTSISPLKEKPRFVSLLFTIPILVIVVWQWQQIIQSSWLLTRSQENINQAEYLPRKELIKTRTTSGLDLLKLPDLLYEQSIPSITIKKGQSSKQNQSQKLDPSISKQNSLSIKSPSNHDQGTNESRPE